MSSISLFDIINVALLDPNIFLCIPASAAAAVNPRGIKTLLANGLITLVILFLAMDQVIYQKKSPDCIIWDNWLFDDLISTDK